MPQFTFRAADCPAIQPCAAAAFLSPADDPATPTTLETLTTGTSTGFGALYNRNAVRTDLIGRWGGGGAHAIASGLGLAAAASLSVPVTRGQARFDGPATLHADSTVAVTDNIARACVWISSAGILTPVNNSLLPPAGRQCYLGSVTTGGGLATGPDLSGVLYVLGGVLWRRTADLNAPDDAPPASVAFYTRTQGGLYWWDGAQYDRVDDSAAAVTADLLVEGAAREDLERRFQLLTAFCCESLGSVPDGLEFDFEMGVSRG